MSRYRDDELHGAVDALRAGRPVWLSDISEETEHRLVSMAFFVDSKRVWTHAAIVEEVRRIFADDRSRAMPISRFMQYYSKRNDGAKILRPRILAVAVRGWAVVTGSEIRLGGGGGAGAGVRGGTSGPLRSRATDVFRPVLSPAVIAEAVSAALRRAGPRGLGMRALPAAVGAEIARGFVVTREILQQYTAAATWGVYLARRRDIRRTEHVAILVGLHDGVDASVEREPPPADDRRSWGRCSSADRDPRSTGHSPRADSTEDRLDRWLALLPPRLHAQVVAKLVDVGAEVADAVEVTFHEGRGAILTYRQAAGGAFLHATLPSQIEATDVEFTLRALAAAWFPAGDGAAADDAEVAPADDHPPASTRAAQLRVLGCFTRDNRCGVPGTLHRVSGIRRAPGTTAPFPCPYGGFSLRVGRLLRGASHEAVPDRALQPLLQDRQSLLVIGAPSTGKTTVLRDLCRRCVDAGLKVVVVDYNGELTGCGPGAQDVVGSVVVLPAASREEQHAVMLEAVANHSPDVVVIDEVGRRQEVSAACDIARRGVALLASVHATSLRELVSNPVVSPLVGATSSVAVGDFAAEQLHRALAEARDTTNFLDQKVQMVRREPAAFHLGLELRRGGGCPQLYADLARAADELLHNKCAAYPPPSPMRPGFVM